MGRLCYPSQAPGTSPGTLARKLSRCKPARLDDVSRSGGEGMAHFLPSGYKFYEHYACRGTMLIGATRLSPVTKLVAGTGAVSRYKLSRSQKFITVQDFNCGQMRVSGCNNYYKIVLRVGAKAKSVTNNLPLLSVLCLGFYFIRLYKLKNPSTYEEFKVRVSW
jgi:hypothetical protein